MKLENKVPVNPVRKNKVRGGDLDKSFSIVIRNREHFYVVVKWLDENIGRGKWKINGKVLKFLKQGKSISRTVKFTSDEYDADQTRLALSLM